jgi:Dolichyl-phosphate-mannose-protein mannosyltransferase
MKSAPDQGRENAALIILFCAALVAHIYFVTFNWRSGFLPGHEFRQTHTALIAYYIDKENNFSVPYSTPLFGKPWSVPLEFPVYEWSVVLLSRAAQLPHFEAARTVSVTCFYLTLPAVWLLLGQLGLARPRRLLALALALTCPLYIFYSRAFLMESMVLMFSAWFLELFVRTMRERRLHWLILCAVCGTGSALVKSTTFFVWLLPAAIYGAGCLWREVRAGPGWKPALRAIIWGLGAVVLPCVSLFWWVKYTDAIKAPHPSAHIFTSAELTKGNYGMYSLAAHLSPETWRGLLGGWREAIMPPWVIALVLAIGIAFSRRERWHILGAAGLFLAAQSMFPFAYALQEYYFYACAVFLLGALGFALHGVLDSGLPRWVRWAIVIVPFAAQLGTYLPGYHAFQSVRSNGGTGLTDALRGITPEGSIIIVAGDDWSPIIPYYSQRKALMIRNGLEYDRPYLDRAFKDLKNEYVSALVLVKAQRTNQELVRHVAAQFGLDTSVTFSHAWADVYLNNICRDYALLRLSGRHGYDQITTQAKPAGPLPSDRPPVPIPSGVAAVAFTMVSPAPSQYRFTYGYSAWNEGGTEVLSIHPDSDLWVPAPAGARQILWEFGLFPGAYEREGEKTDGVVFIVAGEAPDGRRREIFRRLLDPAGVAADRGRQRAVIPYQAIAGETLVFLTRPNVTTHYDWAYLARIEVK